MTRRGWSTVGIGAVVMLAAIGVNLATCGGGAAPPAAGPAVPHAAGVVATGAAFAPTASASADEAGLSRLEGQVIDEAQQPVAGAEVRLGVTDRVATSEADGSFAFDRVPYGAYAIAAHLGELASDVTPVRFTATSDPVTLRVHRGTTLILHVVGADAPVPDAEVVADRWLHARSGPDGAARLVGLGPRFHQIAVDAAGFATATLSLRMQEDPGGTVERTVTLARGAPVSGTVVGPDGKPAVDARVTLAGEGTAPTSEARVDAAGAFAIPAVAAGHYRVTATSKIYGPAPPLAVTVDGATPRAGLLVRLAYDAQLVGTVVDPAGRPLPAMRVAVDAADGGHFEETTLATGRFEMLGVAAGEYTVTAAGGGVAAPELRVKLVDDQRTEIQLIAQPTRITGIVVDPRGEPIADARVSAMPMQVARAAAFAHDTSDAGGHFRLDGLPPGTYTVSATWPDQKSRKLGEGLPVATGTADVKLVLDPPATLTGRVVENGQPVPYYGVLLTEHPEWSFIGDPIAVRAADGRFTLRGVEPGAFGLVVIGPGTAKRVVQATIVAGKTTDLGEITLVRGLRLAGHVTDASGAPVAGARVAVGLSQRADETELKLWFEGDFETTTDASGLYRFDGIAAPEHGKVTASHATRGTAPAAPIPASDGVLDFVLASAGGIDGMVAGFTGRIGFATAHAAERPTERLSAEVDSAGHFHFDGLLPGDYVVALMPMPDRPGTPPVRATVAANERAAVTLAYPATAIAVTVSGATDCRVLSVQRAGATAPTADDFVAVARCRDGSADFAAIAPGDYRICEAKRCAPFSVAATPAQQTIPLQLPAK